MIHMTETYQDRPWGGWTWNCRCGLHGACYDDQPAARAAGDKHLNKVNPGGATVHGVAFLDVEVMDDAYGLTRYDTPVPSSVPEPFRTALKAMLPDEHSCRTCQTPVGYRIADPDQGTVHGGVWSWTTLVHDGHQTWMLCKDCSKGLRNAGPEASA